MKVRWKLPGERDMGEIDLRQIDSDNLVIHFGGEFTSVDAYTFANSLVSFADTVRAINEIVNPGQKIDIRIEAVGTGSFRALVRSARKGLGGLFSRAPENLFWIISALLVEHHVLKLGQEADETIVTDDSIILVRGGERIVIPRDGQTAYENSKKSEKVREGIRKTFKVVSQDEAIENFGVTPSLEDKEPLIQIPREDFEFMRDLPQVIQPEEKRRKQSQRDAVILLKPWINASNKKWSFDWGGVPTSAHVADEGFLERVKSHEVRFGNGDMLDLEFEFYQNFDDERGIWETDRNSYAVTKVFAFWPKGGERITYENAA